MTIKQTIKNMTKARLKASNDVYNKQNQKRVEQIWTEMDEVIAGTGVGALIEELIELEIEAEKECNQ